MNYYMVEYSENGINEIEFFASYEEAEKRLYEVLKIDKYAIITVQ